jgi:putative ABC transport system ATP-binding protein
VHGCACLLVTHSRAAAARAQRVLVLAADGLRAAHEAAAPALPHP